MANTDYYMYKIKLLYDERKKKMKKYISADEARRQLEDLETTKGLEIKGLADKKIREAVKKGYNTVNLDIGYNYYRHTKQWLESIGYKVNFGNDQRDGKWFKVSW